jgi:hypothetical protein
MNAFIGGAALAGVKIASPLSEAQADILKTPKLAMDGSQASPELRDAVRKLDDANEVLKVTSADFQRVWKLNGDWEVKNPRPSAPRAHRKWLRRHDKFFDEIGYDAAFEAHTKAREAFSAAQLVVAQVKVRDLPELALKACMLFVYEDTREKHLRHVKQMIAVSVAIDLAVMSLPEGRRHESATLASTPRNDARGAASGTSRRRYGSPVPDNGSCAGIS